MASYRHVTDEYVGGKSVSWLFSQFWSVQRAQWRQWTGMVTATEVALIRGLSVAFSGKKANLKPLPTWAEASGEKKRKAAKPKSDFAGRVERANTRQQEEQTEELDTT